MDPLLQQIAIGATSLLLGFLLGALTNRSRLRKTRTRGEQQAERLQAELAVQKVQIADLRTRVASFGERKGPRMAEHDAIGAERMPDEAEPIAQSPLARPVRAYSLREQTSDPARSQR